MSEGMEEWLCDSNEALELNLGGFHSPSRLSAKQKLKVRAPEDYDALEGEELATVEPFSPTFTYPIFGEQEKIFGYKGLNINVSSKGCCGVELTPWCLAAVVRFR